MASYIENKTEIKLTPYSKASEEEKEMIHNFVGGIIKMFEDVTDEHLQEYVKTTKGYEVNNKELKEIKNELSDYL